MSSLWSYFMIVTLVYCKISVSFCKVCTAPVASLVHYRRPCNSSDQCITRNCIEKRCLCSTDKYFDVCTSLCLPNCQAVVTNEGGLISTPDYPYSSSQSCEWTIEGRGNSYVVFSIINLEYSTANSSYSQNYINFYDGTITLQKQVYFADHKNITTVASISRSMKIFVTQQNRFNTFTGIYRIYDQHSQINETSGYIASPGYPGKYPKHAHFTWTIFGTSVTLKLLNLQMENCCDKITIYNGTTASSKLMIIIYNYNITRTVSTNTSMHIVFTTDASGEYPGFNAFFYRQELKYGDKCELTISSMCKGPDLVCRYDRFGETRCLCSQGKYHYQDKCFNDILFHIQPQTTEVTLIFSPKTSFFGHNITWSADKDVQDLGQLKITETKHVNVTGLNPGEEYIFKIISTLTPDVYVDETPVQSTFRIFTLPAEPGGIIEGQSNLQKSPYVIKFQPSPGIVHHYNITFESNSSQFTYQVESTELVTSDLIPDTEYNYTIIAFNKLGNYSETFTGNVITGAVQEDAFPVANIEGIITGVIIVLIIIVVITVVMVTQIRRRHPALTEINMQSPSRTTYTNRTYTSLPTAGKSDTVNKCHNLGRDTLLVTNLGQGQRNVTGSRNTSNDNDLYTNSAAIVTALGEESYYEDLS